MWELHDPQRCFFQFSFFILALPNVWGFTNLYILSLFVSCSSHGNNTVSPSVTQWRELCRVELNCNYRNHSSAQFVSECSRISRIWGDIWRELIWMWNRSLVQHAGWGSFINKTSRCIWWRNRNAKSLTEIHKKDFQICYTREGLICTRRLYDISGLTTFTLAQFELNSFTRNCVIWGICGNSCRFFFIGIEKLCWVLATKAFCYVS
jgi:hypothetical protein